MTDGSWDDYVETPVDPNATPAQQVGELATNLDDLSAAAGHDPAVSGSDLESIEAADTATDQAAGAQSWSDWNAATGDEASQSAQSYYDSAASDAAAGYTDLAANEIADGNAQMDYASGKYETAAGQAADAGTDLQWAGADLGAVDTSSYDTTAADVAPVADESASYEAAPDESAS